jgi:EAL domain-containing protein (putative c-di-GMP-specific phosphodiesterase class I)/GAF domain-containing protein
MLMEQTPKAVREAKRIDALRQLDLLDTPASERFDRITRMASHIFDLPIAAMSLTDNERQWFKSRIGIEQESIPREQAPCAAVAEMAANMVISDLLDDEDYADSPLAQQGVRFYAGAPLVTREGYGIGALCVMGTDPRTATPAEMAALGDLAGIAMAQIEMGHSFGRIEPISGLPNRTQFLEDLADLGRDDGGRRRLGVLVDLARADQIDHAIRVMGPAYVDDFVREAARSLRALLRPPRASYHVAPTQFMFLAPLGIDDTRYIEAMTRLLERTRIRFDAHFSMTMAIGLAPFVTGVTPPEDVLRMAHSAAHDAQEAENPVVVYSAASDEVHRRRFLLLNDFSAALDQPGELRLVFQPRIDLADGACHSAEALLRWTHPFLGEISPTEFIPLIEQTRFARAATAWVLDTALARIAAWSDAGQAMRLSVNITAGNLAEKDFAVQVQLLLLKHRVRPEMLELEVTESAFMASPERALIELDALHAAGIGLAIDDFGTGHSSLAYLQRLPVDVVKIDQSFILDLTGGDRERTLVRSMITLSHDLGYRVVAEGVEDAATARLLAVLGCDEAQGFHFSRPLEGVAFARWRAARMAAEPWRNRQTRATG